MNTKPTSTNRTILITSILAVAACSQAATFNYNSALGTSGDVLFGFRSTNTSSANSVVVDLGSIATFTNLANGQTITNYSGNYYSYVTTNNLAWSVLCGQRVAGNNRVWITRPRSGLYTQSTPWQTRNGNLVGSVAVQIDGIGNHAVNIAYAGSSAANNDTAVVEANGGTSPNDFSSYAYTMTYVVNGNPGGTFWGDSTATSVEQITPGGFTTNGVNSRADFYEIVSTTTNRAANYLGYFDLSPSGVLTFTKGPSAAPAPSITSIVNNLDGTFAVSFTTVPGATYSLVKTNAAGLTAPKSTWPATGASLTGDGTVLSLIDASSDDSAFYAVSVQ